MAFARIICCRCSVVSFLIHNYGCRIDKASVVSWFEATCNSLKRYSAFDEFIEINVDLLLMWSFIACILALNFMFVLKKLGRFNTLASFYMAFAFRVHLLRRRKLTTSKSSKAYKVNISYILIYPYVSMCARMSACTHAAC